MVHGTGHLPPAVVRRLDPRTKLISFALLSALGFVFNDPVFLGVELAVALTMATLAGSLGAVWKMRLMLTVVFIATVCMWQLYVSGPTRVATIGPLEISSEGLSYGLATALRFVYLVVLGVTFAAITPPEDVVHALVKLRVPFQVAFIVGTTMRLVPIYVNTAGTIVEAQQARGLDLMSRNPLARVRRIVPLVIPIVMHAARTGERLALAFETKGFRPHARRTYFRESSMRGPDYATLAAVVTLTIACLILRWLGYGTVISGRL
jgi:energy-coupling factor transport system permease protein